MSTSDELRGRLIDSRLMSPEAVEEHLADWCRQTGATGGTADEEFVDWLVERFASLRGAIDMRTFWVSLDAHYLRVRDGLLSHGLGIDSVIFLGSPGAALEALIKHKSPPADVRHLGLDIEPIAGFDFDRRDPV